MIIYSKTSGVRGIPPSISSKLWSPPWHETVIKSRTPKKHKHKKNFNRNYLPFNKGKFIFFCSRARKQEILKALTDLSTVKIRTHIGYRQRRVKKHFLNRGDMCVVCKQPAEVLHHVILIMNGGPNKRENIVELCHNCHYEIHPWMVPPTPTEIKELDTAFRNTLK